jgi:hypothetical protein
LNSIEIRIKNKANDKYKKDPHLGLNLQYKFNIGCKKRNYLKPINILAVRLRI